MTVERNRDCFGFAFATTFDWVKQVLRHPRFRAEAKAKPHNQARGFGGCSRLLIGFFFKVKQIASYFGFWLVESFLLTASLIGAVFTLASGWLKVTSYGFVIGAVIALVLVLRK